MRCNDHWNGRTKNSSNHEWHGLDLKGLGFQALILQNRPDLHGVLGRKVLIEKSKQLRLVEQLPEPHWDNPESKTEGFHLKNCQSVWVNDWYCRWNQHIWKSFHLSMTSECCKIKVCHLSLQWLIEMWRESLSAYPSQTSTSFASPMGAQNDSVSSRTSWGGSIPVNPCCSCKNASRIPSSRRNPGGPFFRTLHLPKTPRPGAEQAWNFDLFINLANPLFLNLTWQLSYFHWRV